jgi:ribosome-associated translation inhibitor RaiA
MTPQIRTAGVELSSADRWYIQRRVDAKAAKFEGPVQRMSLRLDDVNGPKGGVDKVCKAKVEVSGLPSVVVERRDRSARAVVDETLEATERALRKALGRRRLEPRRAH